jgi:hypothetical protein
MCLYAQGYSMTDYLVKRSSRQHFLAFVGRGTQAGWDRAIQEYYGHKNVDELEAAWLQFLRDGRQQPAGTLVAGTKANPGATQVAAAPGKSQVRVHLTVPPTQPTEITPVSITAVAPGPVARGAMPSPDQVGQKFGQTITIPPNWQPAVTLQAPVTSGLPSNGVQLLPPQGSSVAAPSVPMIGLPR